MYLLGDGAFIKVGNLVGPIKQMAIDTLFGDVEFAIREPLEEMKIIDSEYGFREGMPIDLFGLLLPVVYRVFDGEGMGDFVGKVISKYPG